MPSDPFGNTAASHDQTTFASPVVMVGKLRCGPDHPQFREPLPTVTNCFVFPRVSVWIEQEGRPPFVGDVNAVTLHNPGRPFRRRAITAQGARSDWFALAPDVLRDMIATYDPRQGDADQIFPFGRAQATASIYLAQRRIYRYVRECDEPDPLLVEEQVIALAMQVLGTAYRDGGPPGVPCSTHQRRLVERTREYLGTAAAAGGGLDALAREVGSSVFHLCRIFKQETGMTIHQYRTELRLRRSLETLEQGRGDILSAALRFGYSSHSHYTRTFQKVFGLPPSRYVAEPGVAGRRQ